MKRKISIVIVVCLFGLIAAIAINTKNNEPTIEVRKNDSIDETDEILMEIENDRKIIKEKNNMAEGIKIKIINAENIKTSQEYTLYDIIKENRNPEEIKIKEDKEWWEKEPENEAEAEFLASVKAEEELLKKLKSIEEKIRNAKTESEKQILQQEFQKVFESLIAILNATLFRET